MHDSFCMRPSMPGEWQSFEDDIPASVSSQQDPGEIASVKYQHSLLLQLPSELLDQILSFLPPVPLINISLTCNTLNRQANADRLWKEFITECVPDNGHTYQPFDSWKTMYTMHYPYWFLPKHKIWFSDKTGLSNHLTGQLMLVRYDYRIGCIEGYRLRAEHPENDTSFRWTYDPNVVVHEFEPKIGIFLDDPIVKLDMDSFEPGVSRLQQEVSLFRHSRRRGENIRSFLFPTQAIPRHRQTKSMAMWPPPTIPADERVRSESASLFKDSAHKPSSFDEMSQTTFRLRKYLDFGGLSYRLTVRTGEDVTTWSTILPQHYTPTEEKPYQGLWVGDYAAHGCEFLIIIQSTPEEARRLPPVEEQPQREAIDGFLPDLPHILPPAGSCDPPGCSGRLDAVKLTGDPNIPRGQPSWIAEDIGQGGLLRIADEPHFEGARVVKSAGHIAAGGFRMDRYTPSQLIMISHDTLAQYWIEMGHISYFKRIHIDDYLAFPKQ